MQEQEAVYHINAETASPHIRFLQSLLCLWGHRDSSSCHVESDDTSLISVTTCWQVWRTDCSSQRSLVRLWTSLMLLDVLQKHMHACLHAVFVTGQMSGNECPFNCHPWRTMSQRVKALRRKMRLTLSRNVVAETSFLSRFINSRTSLICIQKNLQTGKDETFSCVTFKETTCDCSSGKRVTVRILLFRC